MLSVEFNVILFYIALVACNHGDCNETLVVGSLLALAFGLDIGIGLRGCC